jgi:hypothetical protein
MTTAFKSISAFSRILANPFFKLLQNVGAKMSTQQGPIAANHAVQMGSMNRIEIVTEGLCVN